METSADLSSNDLETSFFTSILSEVPNLVKLHMSDCRSSSCLSAMAIVGQRHLCSLQVLDLVLSLDTCTTVLSYVGYMVQLRRLQLSRTVLGGEVAGDDDDDDVHSNHAETSWSLSDLRALSISCDPVFVWAMAGYLCRSHLPSLQHMAFHVDGS